MEEWVNTSWSFDVRMQHLGVVSPAITMSPSPGEDLPQYRDVGDIGLSPISGLGREDFTRARAAAPGAWSGLLPTLRIFTVTSVTRREVFFTRMNSRRQWWSRLRVMIVITEDVVIVFVMMGAGILDTELLPEVPEAEACPRLGPRARWVQGGYIGPSLCS